MTRLYISIAVSAQLLASAAFAQIEGDTSFGTDWSSSLGTAIFADDRSTVRSADEIGTQWITLSEEDRSMIRRDCMVHMQVPVDGAADSSAGGSTDIGSLSDTGTTTDMGATANTTADTTADTTAGTTADTSTSADTGLSTGTGDAAATTDLGTAADVGITNDGLAAQSDTSVDGAASTNTSDILSVSSAQMDEICAATKDL